MILNEPADLPVFYGTNMVAAWLGVSTDAVTNWMKRFDDIPAPDAKKIGPARTAYQWRGDKREEWVRWAAAHGVCYRPGGA
jgi:hypothetical protein